MHAYPVGRVAHEPGKEGDAGAARGQLRLTILLAQRQTVEAQPVGQPVEEDLGVVAKVVEESDEDLVPREVGCIPRQLGSVASVVQQVGKAVQRFTKGRGSLAVL